mmetsp:Transcript_42990/g.71679  ORF Transcript_42990/g.71679 Transcript_42990/m.71679 type:complete len:234 (+) Transcript_42990:355-1056(+)
MLLVVWRSEVPTLPKAQSLGLPLCSDLLLVAVRVLLAPLPRGGHALAEIHEARCPVKLASDQRSVREHLRVVPRPRQRLLHHRDVHPRHLAASVDELLDGIATAGAHVVERGRVAEVRRHRHVRVHQVCHVDVVADARPIWSGELRPVDGEGGDLPKRCVKARPTDAPLGAELWAGELSEAAGGVGPVDVEVAQHRRCELRGARRVVTHHLLSSELGLAVGVDGVRGRLLRDG